MTKPANRWKREYM